MEDTRNVQDRFKNWETDLIRDHISSVSTPLIVAMMNINGDFNLSTVLRSANAFGARKVYYVGGKKGWDRRGAVGVQNYTPMGYLHSIRELDAVVPEDYSFVALEQANNSVALQSFKWSPNTCLLIGEEGRGLSTEELAHCAHVVEIPQIGSVRSLNAGVASGIAMYDYLTKIRMGQSV